MKKITLSQQVKAEFVVTKKVENHQGLGCLCPLAVKGRVPVKIFAFTILPAGRLLHFKPIDMPGIEMSALRPNFEIPLSPMTRALRELLSL